MVTAAMCGREEPVSAPAGKANACMFQTLNERVEEEIDKGLVSDVCFGAGHGESVHLFSSRAALALASPVFQTMFFAPQWHMEPREPASGSGSARRPLDETAADGGFRPEQHLYVAITDVEPSALRCVLRYVHHLDPRLSLDNTLHVYRAADKYQMDGLLGACSAHLTAHVDPHDLDQVLRLFDTACRLGVEGHARWFLEKLGELSRVQTSRLLVAEEFWALHSVSMATLLESDGFCVDEEPLWISLRRWAQLHTAGAEEALPELSPEEHFCDRSWKEGIAAGDVQTLWQDVLRPLKRFIRFPAMQPSFFANEVAQSGLLTTQEVVEVFCYLSSSRNSDPSRPALVANAFRPEPRVPQLVWNAAPGRQQELGLVEECSLGIAGGYQASTAVLDGIGHTTGPWGSQLVLGGSGAGFHCAFGSQGFSSGRHSWTISWQPINALQPGGRSPRFGRGGAVGIAREPEAPAQGASPLASALAAAAAPPAVQAKSGPLSGGPPPRGPAATAGGLSSHGTIIGIQGSEDPAAQFLDWPTCIVFGVKQQVSERRYVAWEPPSPSDGSSGNAAQCLRFAVTLDFGARTVTYVVDGGNRQWSAPLTHDGPVYPVVAASGLHYFRIEYGFHI